MESEVLGDIRCELSDIAKQLTALPLIFDALTGDGHSRKERVWQAMLAIASTAHTLTAEEVEIEARILVNVWEEKWSKR